MSLACYNLTSALPIPLQVALLDHLKPDGCGVIVELGDSRVEFLLRAFGSASLQEVV